MIKEQLNIFIFGSDRSRMGISTPYALAINEKQEVFSTKLDQKGFDLIYKINNYPYNKMLKRSIQMYLNNIEFAKSNNKKGWQITDYPIQTLLDSESLNFKPAIYREENFKVGKVVYAGMGNWGFCSGLFNIQTIEGHLICS
jgi:hypothetical protein